MQCINSGIQLKHCIRRNVELNTYFRKEKKSKIYKLSFHLEKLELKEQIKPQASRRRKKVKIRAAISKIKNGETLEGIIETKS